MQSTDPSLTDILGAAVTIARGAGAILREGFETRRGTAVQFKTSDIDPVTEYDIRSEQFIVGELRKLFPSHQIVGEEGGAYRAEESRPPARNYLWHIDPLDGTVNFAHGFPMFCVSMGLLIDGVPSLGVVYNPATDETFAAALGLGATRNDRPIHVSATLVLNRALVITGFSYDTHTSDSNMKNFLGFQRSAQATRRIGSAALNLCYTATGQLDGHWEMKVKPHDIAAGIVLVREAGGTVTDFDGGDEILSTGRIVSSNGLIHREMLDVLKAADDRG
ncbi:MULTISPECIES: inositol monophosphatase family protein [unclassified Methylocaldum]|jgi:myo-inositol-1(or 4)-monophosphatase|uniref:inositol monophosphatase family protein n=1 Tax=unclassified Methylocaldum TaxID=2622260 RepID=UPI001AE6CB37|nr:inositol monophosphatase family protein [Methylocaldum sp. RMAD-M]MBP1148199.1 myo-inositol-1(or 4)-monophosphatase [Methylocaldum sp. RMAD-M]MDV3241588.1 inositol monophosphatase [Methylocaldum sp.]